MQITVLTMYTGQMFLLRRLMPKSLYEGVRVTPVDNFQGEENDIILLSLVRSNELGRIGFLHPQPRLRRVVASQEGTLRDRQHGPDGGCQRSVERNSQAAESRRSAGGCVTASLSKPSGQCCPRQQGGRLRQRAGRRLHVGLRISAVLWSRLYEKVPPDRQVARGLRLPQAMPSQDSV